MFFLREGPSGSVNRWAADLATGPMGAFKSSPGPAWSTG